MELRLSCINPYMQQWTSPSLVQIKVSCLSCTKLSSKPVLVYCYLNPWEQILSDIWIDFHKRNKFEYVVAKSQPHCLGLHLLMPDVLSYHARSGQPWIILSLRKQNCGSISVNALHALFFRGNKNIYSHLMSLLHIDMTQEVEILPQVSQVYLFYIVNIMGADVLATQGARAPAPMILTMLNQINSVPTH